MGRPRSFGSKSNRDRRKAVADANAKHRQVRCTMHGCTPKHREGRHFPMSNPPDSIDLTRTN